MQNARLSVSSTASTSTPAPFTTSQVVLTKQEHIQLKQQASQWRAMWKAACDREQKALTKNSEITLKHKTATATLNAQIDELKSELAHMKHLLFGRKSEKTSSSSKKSGNTTRPPSNRKRAINPGLPVAGAIFTTICLWFMSQWIYQWKSSVVQPVIYRSDHFSITVAVM